MYQRRTLTSTGLTTGLVDELRRLARVARAEFLDHVARVV